MATPDDAVSFTDDDVALIVMFAGCSLDEKPGSNWVQAAGGLPDFICRIAKAIKKTGKSTSQAIAIAVSRVKKWAAGGDDVDADTQAKAAKALAAWERLKSKGGKGTVKATALDAADDGSLSDADLHLLIAATLPCHRTATDQVLLSITSRPSALEQVLARRTGT